MKNKNTIKICVILNIVLIIAVGVLIIVIVKTRLTSHEEESKHISTQGLHNQTSKGTYCEYFIGQTGQQFNWSVTIFAIVEH